MNLFFLSNFVEDVLQPTSHDVQNLIHVGLKTLTLISSKISGIQISRTAYYNFDLKRLFYEFELIFPIKIRFIIKI